MCSKHAEGSSRPRPETEVKAIDRRAFLKLSGAGLAGVTLFGSLGTAGALAQAPPKSAPESSLVAEFRDAADEYGVPMGLLMAMGWVNTRWEMPSPEANEYQKGDLHGWGSYGIMALVQNPSSDTLGAASKLTGIPKEELKTNRAANIRGAAALLASSMGQQKPSEPRGFFAAVAGRGRAPGREYAAVAGIGGGELYAEEVLETLERGASKTTLSGEQISLPARQPTSSTPESP
jgi:hypothetical protein